MDEADQILPHPKEEEDEFEVARRQRHARREAITKTWGYNLYKEIVEFPSDVLSFLRSNILPPYSVIKSAQAFREEPASQVQRIDARLLAIEQETEALKIEKDALWKESKAYRTKLRGCDTVLSPLRRIPFDIIHEIASHTLPYHPNPCIKQSPLNISQTSSVWRAAAQSLPQLWSTIYVRVDLEGSWLKPSSQIAEFMIHAKKRPISLMLFFDGTRKGSLSSRAMRQLVHFLKDIGPNMHQVERLGIGAHDLGYIWGHLDLAGSSWNLASLKYLHTINQDVLSGDGGSTIDPATIFQDAPALTHLSAHGGFFSATDDGDLPVHSSSLTELRLGESLSVRGWADLLDHCPRLETGKFRIHTWDNSEPRALVRTHEAIQDLSLQIVYKKTTATEILSQFRMPAFRVLRLSSEEDSGLSIPPPLIFPSYANIRYLQIGVTWDQDPSYTRGIICETINLEELVLTSCPLSFSAVFDAMTIKSSNSIPDTTVPTSTDSNILPSLSIVRVQVHSAWTRDQAKVVNETTICVDAFARMLNSRRRSQVPFGWQALQNAIFQPHYLEGSSSSKTVTEDLLEKTAPAQSEGLMLCCLHPWSDELWELESDLPVHPFHMWLAPETFVRSNASSTPPSPLES
ncbi:hypothetical protein CPB83DRAFT_843391 [Crepidotus variabilis]|uniref:F-box domain-containing protein n=1 Tax=Crepidotus variabilis TaxID=179855 RepID=A0A9P6JW08_9AGAR|nr:hypothetical protein CPB83DRAFT_843391 [Crepidotus variabilis]